jgi:hypothetical protein
MESCQPFVEDVRVEAAWSGDLSSAVNLEIFIDIVPRSRSHLSLIRNDHRSVLFSKVARISNLLRSEEDSSPAGPSGRHGLLQQEILDSPNPISNIATTRDQQNSTMLLLEERSTGRFNDRETCRNADTTHPKDRIHFVSYDQPKSSAETADIPLFSQTASLYEAASSRDSISSPPAPPTSKKLTIPKRLSFEPKSFLTSNPLSPTNQGLSQKDDRSPESIRKRPVSRDKRPPWRPVGVQDTTQRGRKQLGTDVAKRRISRSAGTVHLHRGRTRHRQSSLPGSIPNSENGIHALQAADRHKGVQTLPRERLMRSPIHTTPRDRDTTVKVTRYAEALNATERLEKWLDDRRNEWPTEDLSSIDFTSDDDNSFRIANFRGSLSPALSPSPTPSSRIALPWTSSRGIRGGGSIDRTDVEFSEEAPIPTLVEDNGTTFVFFQGRNTGECKSARFRIEIHASIQLEAQPLGFHTLAIPGLPLQSGSAEGTFRLRITGVSSCGNDNFKAYEKVAYIDDRFATHPLQDDQMWQNFRLDTPFGLKLLCYEACHLLEPSEFEIDSDVHTRYDCENLDGDGITAEHSMICSLRLHPFLMWAENVTLKLYLVGGPSGTLETSLEPGNRRIYLEGKRCDAEHELEISLVCPVADLQKPFTVSWEQYLGRAPFEVWLPRISGLYRKKLDDLFDLPDEASVSIAARPCRKSRVYSMAAEEDFLKSSSAVYFFPENQHTARTIRQSLTDQSGQFYDELTAKDLVPVSSAPLGQILTPRVKHETIALKPNKRLRTVRSKFSKDLVTEPGHWPVIRAGAERNAETTTPVDEAGKPLGVVPIEAVPRRPKSILARSGCFMLHMICWFFYLLAAPAKFFKNIILMWLCFRAFDHDRVVMLEASIRSNALAAWDRWDFEPVQLHDDFTGWKHLMAKVNKGTARLIHDGHIGAQGPMDRETEEMEEAAEEISVPFFIEEVRAAETLAVEQPALVPGEYQANLPQAPDAEEVDEEPLTFLDKIDRALGWKPSTGAQ